MKNLLGRQEEQTLLAEIVASTKPAFVALYGRRRVGKTYLIKEYFNHEFTFYATASANSKTKAQLASFTIFLNEAFNTNHDTPTNWLLAFNLLKKELVKIEGDKIIFLDELPWFDTKRSDFMEGLEIFWNGWASTQKGLKLIVCGSAASWMINKLLRNKRGLHNRVTHRMKIEPFTLKETEQFLQAQEINLDRYQIINLYMVMGGIPFYLEQIRKGESSTQCIERLCFSKNGKLVEEFKFIFSSLFKNSDKHEAILRAIYKLGNSTTRDALIEELQTISSGDFTNKLSELQESGFIKSYLPIGVNKSKRIYVIADYYTLFYLKFIEHASANAQKTWINKIDDAAIKNWKGAMYEQVCWDHTEEIKKALGIDGIYSETSTWQKHGNKEIGGAQIDLVFDRKDRTINLFEIKYSSDIFTITKDYDLKLRNKVSVFKENTSTKKSVFLTMITTFGLTQNQYAHSVVSNSLKMDDLF
jgi:uncharacterized protein